MDSKETALPEIDLGQIRLEREALQTDAFDEESPVATAYVKFLDREHWTAQELLQTFEALPAVQKLCAQQDLEDALWVRRRIFDFLEKAIMFASQVQRPAEESREHAQVSLVHKATRKQIARTLWQTPPQKIQGVPDSGDISLAVFGALRHQFKYEVAERSEEPLRSGLRTIPEKLVTIGHTKWQVMNITALIDSMEKLLREQQPEQADVLQEMFLRFLVHFAGKQEARKLEAYYHMQESTRALLITEITRRIHCDVHGIR